MLRVIISNKNVKAPGMNTLKAETLKETKMIISKPLAHLLNKSIESGIFPSECNIAVVKPLLKKGDRRKILNNRPISLILI